MLLRRISLGLLFLTMICSTGCNRSLRDLIGKSDFYSKDELAAAEQDDATTTVSSGKTLDADEESEEKPSRLSRLLNISALLRRDRESDDTLGDDPFATSEETESDENNGVEPVSVEKAERLLVDTADDANFAEAKGPQSGEEKAEDLLRKYQTAARENDIADIFGRSGAAAEDIEKELKDAETLTDGGGDEGFSFDEFLADTETDTKNVAEDAAADEFFNADTETAGEIVEAAEEEVRKQLTVAKDEVASSDLFPEMDELLADTQDFSNDVSTQTASARDAFDKLVEASENKFDNELAMETESPSEDTKPFGFESKKPAADDPWAAFRNSPSIRGNQVAAGAPQWSQEASSGVESFNEANPIDFSEPSSLEESRPFHSVSARREVNDPDKSAAAAFDEVFAAPAAAEEGEPDLTLDAAAESDAFAEPESAPTLEQVPASSDNPFGDDGDSLFESDSAEDAIDFDNIFDAEGIDASEELLEEDLLSTEAVKQAPVEKTAGLPFGLSSRTWFLMVGLAVIGLLLFMPERKNQTN